MQIRLKDIFNNNFTLSPSNYNVVDIKTLNKFPLRDLVEKIDKGVEVGSNNYVDNSEYHYIRTSAFNNKYSIVEDNNSVLCVSANSFIDMHLKKDDLLIVKDSNVGEVAILERDYPNYMFSSGINRLHIKNNKYYIYAVMKNRKFREQLISKIPKGATIMHAKDLYLDCLIPYPENSSMVDYIEKLVSIVINKEKEIKKKISAINYIIDNELKNNQNTKNIGDFKYPKFSQILKINRLDTGNYTEEFTYIDNLIKNYKNGYYYIEPNNISGGNTPTQRFIDNNKDLKYYWITPTYINEDGTNSFEYKINCNKNNINENCMLIINRTSKGGFGEYVGISSFYNYNKYGKAQHNQGIYKIKNMPDKTLIYMTCLLNSPSYRKLCANLSMGSKMKELKLNNILSIPFPKFPEELIDNINKLYFNDTFTNYITDHSYIEDSFNWDKKAGVIDLFEAINIIKEKINSIIEDIYLAKETSKEFDI